MNCNQIIRVFSLFAEPQKIDCCGPWANLQINSLMAFKVFLKNFREQNFFLTKNFSFTPSIARVDHTQISLNTLSIISKRSRICLSWIITLSRTNNPLIRTATFDHTLSGVRSITFHRRPRSPTSILLPFFFS